VVYTDPEGLAWRDWWPKGTAAEGVKKAWDILTGDIGKCLDSSNPYQCAYAAVEIACGAKIGTANGEIGGSILSKAAKKLSKKRNKEENGGVEKCVDCKKTMIDGQQRKKGVPVPKNESQSDHVHPKAKGGDGATPKDMRNIKQRCAECNNKKSDTVPIPQTKPPQVKAEE